MLQLQSIPFLPTYFEGYFLFLAIMFLAFGIIAFGWLAIHVEHSRHFSKFKVFWSILLGAIFFGFGIHLLLLTFGV